MVNRAPFAIGEWYHCFNRGVEKRIVFCDERDANRFLMLLHLANGTKPIEIFNIPRPSLERIFKSEKPNRIVAIGAYCLMPNHFHLLIKEFTEGGITSFMRKLSTAYTMYFNARNERVGNLFIHPFRSRHVDTDLYFQRVLQYIHINPAELYEPGWKSGTVRDMRTLKQKLIAYQYSSFAAFIKKSISNPILAEEVFEVSDQPPITRMLEEARIYYAGITDERFER